MFNLLDDALIGIRTPEGARKVSLPQLYAQLTRGEVEEQEGLRAHQADPWRVFLVQVAASILARHSRDPIPSDDSYWREGLLDLADGHASAWELVVDDVTKPALWQHPLPAASGMNAFKLKAGTPDELDVLITAKNHDVKMARFDAADPEAWLYALMMVQTTIGFLGKDNFGIIRMNGGFGSRPILSWSQDLHYSRRFLEELGVVLRLRADALSGPWGYREGGAVLTWLTAWDRGGHQLQTGDLEPWFIETARPLRLVLRGDALQAFGATSKARQIGPASLDSGDLGDPWTPINVSDKKKGRSALTLSRVGFSPDRIVSLLFQQGFALTGLQQPREGAGDGWFSGSVFVRGQGTTDGFHTITLAIPAKARRTLLQPGSRESLGKSAQQLLIDARDVSSIARGALAVLCEGGLRQPDYERDTVLRWIEERSNQLNAYCERQFFSTLWRAVDEPFDIVRADWQRGVVEQGARLLLDAEQGLPVASGRVWRARVSARNYYYGSLRKKGLLPESIEEEATA